MKNKKVDIEKITRELIHKEGIQQPGDDFTKSLMAKILKDPNVQISYVKKDDDKNMIFLFLLSGVLFLAYFGYYIYKNGLKAMVNTDNLPGISYLHTTSEFISKLWSEITFSPYILLSFAGIILLVLFDKYIVKYLYSI